MEDLGYIALIYVILWLIFTDKSNTKYNRQQKHKKRKR